MAINSVWHWFLCNYNDYIGAIHDTSLHEKIFPSMSTRPSVSDFLKGDKFCVFLIAYVKPLKIGSTYRERIFS